MSNSSPERLTVGRSYHITSKFPPFEPTHSTLERDKTRAYWESTRPKSTLESSSPILYGKHLPPIVHSSVSGTGTESSSKTRNFPSRTCGIKYLITSTFPPFEHTRSGGVFQDLLDSMHSKDLTTPTDATYYSTTPFSSTTGIDYSLAKGTPRGGNVGSEGYKEPTLESYYHTTGARALPTFDKSFYFQKKHPRMSVLTSQFPPFESNKFFSVAPPHVENAPENFQLFNVTGARDLPYPEKMKTAPLRVHPADSPTVLQPSQQKLEFTTRSISPETRRSLGDTVENIRSGETRNKLSQTLYTSVKPEDFLIGTSTRYHGTFKYPQ